MQNHFKGTLNFTFNYKSVFLSYSISSSSLSLNGVSPWLWWRQRGTEHCHFFSLWRTDGRYFCATVRRFQSIACCKRVMRHHFGITDSWRLTFHGQENKAIMASVTFLFLQKSKSNCSGGFFLSIIMLTLMVTAV